MVDRACFPNNIRRIILERSKRANVGHIGSALSIADIIAALYGTILNIKSPEDPDRDRFVLSKGHAALALYAALYLKGWITEECLNTYCLDNSLLGTHPEHQLRGIDFSSGSLGYGISIAAGAALAARLQKSTRRAFVVVSDGECDEGSVWEAAMFASHHSLSNLIALIDLNGQQAFGYTEDILSLSSLPERWTAFGWDVHEVDGHNPEEITEITASLNTLTGPPHILICHTVLGKGVSYMEGKIKWHYWPMSDAEYDQALKEIEEEK